MSRTIEVRCGRVVLVAEVDDVRVRPVVVRVDGRAFEARLPGESIRPGLPSAGSGAATPALRGIRAPQGRSVPPHHHDIRAPLPGVITAIDVMAGDAVAVGQRVCVVEAMKMQNPVSAPREGRVAAVRVGVGDHVVPEQVLVEYEK
jgi:biotin carboxyl carrier protein